MSDWFHRIMRTHDCVKGFKPNSFLGIIDLLQ